MTRITRWILPTHRVVVNESCPANITDLVDVWAEVYGRCSAKQFYYDVAEGVKNYCDLVVFDLPKVCFFFFDGFGERQCFPPLICT